MAVSGRLALLCFAHIAQCMCDCHACAVCYRKNILMHLESDSKVNTKPRMF